MAESVWTPLLYVGLLLTALVIFSKQYRKRKSERLAHTVHLYQHNFAKDVYDSLAAQDRQEKLPPKLLRSALLAWAAEDIARMLRMRDAEPSVTSLHQQELVGDGFFERFAGSKKVTESELIEVSAAAQTLQPGWVHVLKTATEIAQQEAVRRRMDQLDVFRQEYLDMAGRPSPEEAETTAEAGKKTVSGKKAK